jgi:hypothetical protein
MHEPLFYMFKNVIKSVSFFRDVFCVVMTHSENFTACNYSTSYTRHADEQSAPLYGEISLPC